MSVEEAFSTKLGAAAGEDSMQGASMAVDVVVVVAAASSSADAGVVLVVDSTVEGSEAMATF